jgi:hypothetical protein
VPREAAGQGFSLVAVDEAAVRVAFRLYSDNQNRIRPGDRTKARASGLEPRLRERVELPPDGTGAFYRRLAGKGPATSRRPLSQRGCLRSKAYRPSRVRRRMPRRACTARSSSPSFRAAQTNTPPTRTSGTSTSTRTTISAAVIATVLQRGPGWPQSRCLSTLLASRPKAAPFLPPLLRRS